MVSHFQKNDAGTVCFHCMSVLMGEAQFLNPYGVAPAVAFGGFGFGFGGIGGYAAQPPPPPPPVSFEPYPNINALFHDDGKQACVINNESVDVQNIEKLLRTMDQFPSVAEMAKQPTDAHLQVCCVMGRVGSVGIGSFVA